MKSIVVLTAAALALVLLATAGRPGVSDAASIPSFSASDGPSIQRQVDGQPPSDSEGTSPVPVQLWTVMAAGGAAAVFLLLFFVRIALGRVPPPPPQEEAAHH